MKTRMFEDSKVEKFCSTGISPGEGCNSKLVHFPAGENSEGERTISCFGNDNLIQVGFCDNELVRSGALTVEVTYPL